MRSSTTTHRVVLLMLLARDASVLCYIHGNCHHRNALEHEEKLSPLSRTDQPNNVVSLGEQMDIQSSCRNDRDVEFLGSNVLSTVEAPLPASPISVPTLSPIEAWCLTHLDRFYHQSQAMKCPFLRRRYGDILDNVETIIKHTVIRRQCWPLMGPPQAWRPAGVNKKQHGIKYKGMSLEDLRTFVRHDWKPETGKGYYVTGKLTTACYRDDCHFLGPDPDMPIRGLRKYVGVAAHLFDTDQSRATLHSLKVMDDTLVAEWELKGILRLPWHPSLPTLSGTTIYHVDADGLIEKHEEFWNISVVYAFCFTLFPDIAKIIWKVSSDDEAKDHQEKNANT